MKFCPKCGLQLEDQAAFCPTCGHKFETLEQPAAFTEAAPAYSPMNTMMVTEDWNHTAEFDVQDISEHKIYAMIVYLFGVMGVLVALLAAKDSKYVGFHVKQSLKFTIVDTLLALIAVVLAITIIVPIAAAVLVSVLYIIRILCFVSVCKGEAKEPAIIRSIGFLK